MANAVGSEEIPMLRTSERRTFKNCQQQWDYAWNMGLERNGTPAQPLWFGTGIHLALAKWYCGPGTKRGPHPAETWTEYAGDHVEFLKIPGLTDEEEEEQVTALELGTSMMENYVETYGKDEHMYIIQPEQSFALDIPWPEQRSRISLDPEFRRKIMVRYVGTYDLAYRNLINDQLWLEEHKTAARILLNHLSLDDQGGAYWATATRSLIKQGLIGPKERLRGIEYNFMRKGMPDERPMNSNGARTNKPLKRHYYEALDLKGIPYKKTHKIPELAELAAKHRIQVIGDVSKSQPLPLLHREQIHRTSKERNSQLRRIQNEAWQIELIRQGVTVPSKTPTPSCSRFCSYFDLCELDERGGDTKSFMRGVFKKRDMYADHRKSTDE